MEEAHKPVAAEPGEALASSLQGYGGLGTLVGHVLAVMPDHAAYLEKSFAARSPAVMATSDQVAAAILKIAGDDIALYCRDYAALGKIIREEEINFARTGRYRYSSFVETNAHVYSNDDLMAVYMHGLLLSHVLWFMHASSLHFFCEQVRAQLQPGTRVLEIGPGHGLLMYLAKAVFGAGEIHGWDLSTVSLDHTRDALRVLGIDDPHLAVRDMHLVKAGDEQFDLLILSHILEHLDDPALSLQRVRGVLAPGGRLFVNVPINAPMPDHIALLETPDEALALLTQGGFEIVEYAVHTTQGMPVDKAVKRKIAATISIIAKLPE